VTHAIVPEPESDASSEDVPAASMDPATLRCRRLAHPWRIVFILYLLALTTGTHWPRLVIGGDDLQVSDKLLHAAAFGVAALLAWHSRVIRSLPLLWVISVGWAILDEISQGIPQLGRTVSALDAVASAIGVTLAVLFLWSVGPVGGAASRLAHTRMVYSIDEALASPRMLALCALCGVIGAALGGLCGWAIFSYFQDLPGRANPAHGVLLGLLGGSLLGGHAGLEGTRRLILKRRGRPCHSCGSDASSEEFDDDGRGTCRTCGTDLHAGQWESLPTISTISFLRLIAAAIAITVIVFIGSFALQTVILALRRSSALFAGFDSAYMRLQDDTRLVVDLFIVAVFILIGVRVVRRLMARSFDHQHERCVGCGYDLRATAIERGCGVCPECGVTFVAAAGRVGRD